MTARRFTARLCLGIAMAFGLAGPAWSTNAIPDVAFVRQSYMTEDKVTFGIGAWKDPGPEASIMWEHNLRDPEGQHGPDSPVSQRCREGDLHWPGRHAQGRGPQLEHARGQDPGTRWRHGLRRHHSL